MRNITQNGIDLIKRLEAFLGAFIFARLVIPPSATAILSKMMRTSQQGIDEEQAEELLCQDAMIAERAVLRLINVSLTDGQFDALVPFAYNLGGGALQRSTLRRKINREEHGKVPEQFMHWVWAGGRKPKGLIRRRAAEADLYQIRSA